MIGKCSAPNTNAAIRRGLHKGFNPLKIVKANIKRVAVYGYAIQLEHLIGVLGECFRRLHQLRLGHFVRFPFGLHRPGPPTQTAILRPKRVAAALGQQGSVRTACGVTLPGTPPDTPARPPFVGNGEPGEQIIMA